MGKREEKLGEALACLVEVLQRGPRSARALSENLGCSKPSIYTWIEKLKERGHKVIENSEREGARGPKAIVYSLVQP